ncbi:MAG TPA: cupin domain-containing protein [Chloroflexota bacterium]|nr:cupin domain-containing protein [Chloroflexota bacterium]
MSTERRAQPSQTEHTDPGDGSRRLETANRPDNARIALDSIGPQLRSLRLTRGVGLRELARRVSVTPSLLSQMERGAVNPSVVTLFRLAEALETTTDYFFGDGHSTRPEQPALPVVREQDRARITLSGGISWERLTPTDEHDFEFMQCVYPPGATSAPDMQQHPGRDYGILLEGQLDIDVGFATYHLEPGDSIAFDASLPHRLTNTGSVPARTIWVVLERQRRDHPA